MEYYEKEFLTKESSKLSSENFLADITLWSGNFTIAHPYMHTSSRQNISAPSEQTAYCIATSILHVYNLLPPVTNQTALEVTA